jgi:hypothetical protein
MKLNHNNIDYSVTVLDQTPTRLTVSNPFCISMYFGDAVFVFPAMSEIVFTLRSNGFWILKGLHHSRRVLVV